jgi:hypothetical protein
MTTETVTTETVTPGMETMPPPTPPQ